MQRTTGKIPLGYKKVAVICILKSANRLLLLKRKNNPHKNLFTPVGGKLDPFEGPRDAAVRETYEETGIVVEKAKMRFAGTLAETSPGKYNWICYLYLAEISFREAPSCNEGLLQWVDIKALPDLPMPECDLFLYEYALRGDTIAFEAIYDVREKLLELTDEIRDTCLFRQP